MTADQLRERLRELNEHEALLWREMHVTQGRREEILRLLAEVEGEETGEPSFTLVDLADAIARGAGA